MVDSKPRMGILPGGGPNPTIPEGWAEFWPGSGPNPTIPEGWAEFWAKSPGVRVYPGPHQAALYEPPSFKTFF